MLRFAITVLGCVGLAAMAIGDQVQAQTLAEIDVDDQGAVTEVRGAAGKPHGQAPFSEVGGFDMIESTSLPVERVDGLIEGQAAACCKRGGVWRSCETGLAGTIVVDYKGQVIESGGVPDSPIASAVIKAAKSHKLMIVEDGNGERHGLVIADGTLHAPEHLLPK